jgi:hypothetical protein
VNFFSENHKIGRILVKWADMRRLFFAFLMMIGVVSAHGPTFGRPQIDAVKLPVPIIKEAVIVNYGTEIYRGKIDLNPELRRIRDGVQLRHSNDGSFFQNREGLLPAAPRNSYREFVYTQNGIPFPGPARIIIGTTGQVWFTGDHYSHFVKVTP